MGNNPAEILSTPAIRALDARIELQKRLIGAHQEECHQLQLQLEIMVDERAALAQQELALLPERLPTEIADD